MMMISTMNERRRFVMVSQKQEGSGCCTFLWFLSFHLLTELDISERKCNCWVLLIHFGPKISLVYFTWLYELSIGAYFFFFPFSQKDRLEMRDCPYPNSWALTFWFIYCAFGKSGPKFCVSFLSHRQCEGGLVRSWGKMRALRLSRGCHGCRFHLPRLTLTSTSLYYSSIILTQHPSRKAKLCTRREIRKRQRASIGRAVGVGKRVNWNSDRNIPFYVLVNLPCYSYT